MEDVARRAANETYIDSTRKPTVHYPDDINVNSPTPADTSSRNVSNHFPPPLISGRSSISVVETDDGDEIEDYDWSGEEDLVDEEAKFEQKISVKTQPKGWGPKRIITILFSSLVGSTFLSGILATPGILIHFYWYKPHPTAERLLIKQNVQAWLFWAAANVLISWYLAVIVDVIPVITRYMISFAWGHVSEHVKSRIELYNSAKDTVKPLLYAASGWISWTIIFGHIYALYNTSNADVSRASYTPRVAQTVEFLFFLALVVCAQRMLSHTIAFGFHRVTFKERIESVGEALKVIEMLRAYRPKRVKTPGTRTPIFGRGYLSDKDHFNKVSSALGSVTDHKHHRDGSEGANLDEHEGRKSKGKQKRESATVTADHKVILEVPKTPMSSAPSSRPTTPPGTHDTLHHYPPSATASSAGNGTGDNAVFTQTAKLLKSGILHDARNITGKGDIVGNLKWNVNSAHDAKRLARSIYSVFKDRHRKYLLPSDFYPAFPAKEEAAAAFRVFDKDDNGDISRAEIKTTLLKVYKERRFLSRSLRDVGIALKTLDRILLVFAFVVLFFISLSVFGVDATESLTSVYTLGIAASFIFKNAASSTFDAIMFLFVTHPYDTGDRCFIDEEVLVVKKMGLLATVFTRADGSETYYFNSQLFGKFITNVRRSGKMVENVTMQVAWRTPLEKLDALENHLNEWLATEENRWFQPSTKLVLQRIDYQRYLEITILIGHNGTWQDWGLRSARKTAFHAAVQFYCNRLGITCHESPLPVRYIDPNTNTIYQPLPSTGFKDDNNTSMYADSDSTKDVNPVVRGFAKPALGFLPPPDKRSESTLTRARKSKSKKAMLRGSGADGADG